MQKPKIIRKLFLNGPVEKGNINRLVQGVVQINAFDEALEVKKPDPIKLYINSPGGLIYEGFSLLSHMQESKAPIHGIVTGTAYSMAFIILCSCDRRVAYKHSDLMYHILSYGAKGKLTYHEEEAKRTRKLMRVLEEKALKRTKIPKKKIEELSKSGKDWFMTPYEAKKFKIIHKVI